LSIFVRKRDGKYFHVPYIFRVVFFHHECNSSTEIYGMLSPLSLQSFSLNPLSVVGYCQNYSCILLLLSVKEFSYLLLPAQKLANVYQSSEGG